MSTGFCGSLKCRRIHIFMMSEASLLFSSQFMRQLDSLRKKIKKVEGLSLLFNFLTPTIIVIRIVQSESCIQIFRLKQRGKKQIGTFSVQSV